MSRNLLALGQPLAAWRDPPVAIASGWWASWRPRRISLLLVAALVAWLPLVGHAQRQEEIRVGVLDNSHPMSWRDKDGEFKGYSIDMIREVCKDLGWSCKLQPSTLAGALEELKADRLDIAGMSLLPTPERRAQILLARPYYTSFSVWFATKGLKPGEHGVRVAVVGGSAQANFAKAQHWNIVEVATHTDLAGAIIAGKADGMLAPMMTVLGLRTNPDIQARNLVVQPMNEPGLTGATSFGINPHKPWIKVKVDGALERLERNGTFDRINSQYVPFRVN